MSHAAQRNFCNKIKEQYPQYFVNKDVLDVGSMDINGNNKIFFSNCSYTGIDVGPGKNVDVVCRCCDYAPGKQFDVIISTECLEHDSTWVSSLLKMYELLKPGGLLLITIAGEGRKEHGTTRSEPECAPHTNNYYKNILLTDIVIVYNMEKLFSNWEISYDGTAKDIRIAAIKCA